MKLRSNFRYIQALRRCAAVSTAVTSDYGLVILKPQPDTHPAHFD